MAEYIERKRLEEAFDNADPDVCESYPDGYSDWGFGRKNVREVISSVPAADVAPVVHGQWIIGVDDDDFDVKCSKCEWTDIFEVAGIAAVERIAKTMHYCLNCGAKMDGGAENG